MATVKIVLTTDIKALTKNIELVAKRADSLQNDIQTVAVSCLKVIEAHSNMTPLNDLIDKLPQGVRKSALVEWALAYGNVRLLERGNPLDEDKIAKGQTFALERNKLDFNEIDAMANKWWTFKPEKDLLESFDLAKFTAQLIKRYNKAQKDGATIEGLADARTNLMALLQSVDTLEEKL